MKVSKEEIVGMVRAIELLRSGKRNRDAEDAEWRSWFRHIADTVSKVPGVSGEIIESKDKQYYPTAKVVWDPNKIGITAGEVGKLLLDGEPRIMTHAGLGEAPESSALSLRPAAMWPGEYKIVASRLFEILSKAPGPRPKAQYAPLAGDVAGLWEAEVQFKMGSTRHTFYLDAKGNQISGSYTGRLIKGPLKGHIDGAKIQFATSSRLEGTSLHYTYKGTLDGARITGEIDMGEYGMASFSATRKA
jgi:L-seryl-tRNA(Ser) seleniumtransferase